MKQINSIKGNGQLLGYTQSDSSGPYQIITKINVWYVVQLILTVFTLVIAYSNYSLEFYQYYLIILYTESIYISLLDRKLNVFQIFLITLFLFNIAIIAFDCLGFCNFRALYLSSLQTTIYLPDNIAVATLKVIITFLAGVSLGWMISLVVKRDKQSVQGFLKQDNSVFKHVYKRLFYFFTLVLLAKYIIIVIWTFKYGYIALKLGLVSGTVFPWYLTGVEYLCTAFGILTLYYFRSPKEFKINAIIYLIPFILYVTTGERGKALIPVLVLLWIWSTYYKELSKKLIAIAGVMLVFVSVVIGQFRKSFAIGSITFDSSMAETVLSFVEGQSISMSVISLVIMLKDSFVNKTHFFLGYFVDLLNINSWDAKAYTYEVIAERNFLSPHLAYTISPERYFSGHSMGTAIIAEFYELVNGNMFFLMLIGVAFMLITIKIARSMYNNPVTYAFAFTYMGKFFYSPRDSIGKVLGLDLLYPIIIVCLVFILDKYIINNIYNDSG